MSTPLIWIGLPLAAAIGLMFLQKRVPIMVIAAGIVCFGLAAAALLLPIASTIKIGPLSFEVNPTFAILGRRFVLDNGNRAFLVFIYIVAGFWLLGARVTKPDRLFVPVGLAMVALLVAAAAVQPFLYAAMLVEMAVLISIPMLAPPGRLFNQGVLRYLIFQSLAVPFILLAGWALAAVEANPSNSLLYPQAQIFLGLGFAFWLAIFPFYTWIPMLVEQAHPYAAGFVIHFLSTVILLLMLSYLDSFAWLRSNALLFQALRLIGMLMVVTGGVWAAFQKNQARLLGYAVILENGFALLAISLGLPAGAGLFVQILLPRAVGVAVLALALSIWKNQNGFSGFDHPEGLLRRSPLTALTFLCAYFSLAGMPLLAAFPSRQVLLEGLASQSISVTLAVLFGMLGYLFGGLRAVLMMLSGETRPWARSESGLEMVMLITGVIMLFAIGLLPNFFLSGFLNMLQPFIHLR